MEPIDNNGMGALGMGTVRFVDGQTLVQVRGTVSRNLVNNTFLIGPPWLPGIIYRAFNDIDGNGVSALAALMQNNQTGAHLLQIRDAATGAVMENDWQ